MARRADCHAHLSRTPPNATPTRAQFKRHLKRLDEDLGRFELELSERGKLKGADASQGGALPGASEQLATAAGDDKEHTDQANSAKRGTKRRATTETAVTPQSVPAAPPVTSGKGARSAGRPPAPKRPREPDLDLDLGPDLAEDTGPQIEQLYPDFRLPVASKEDSMKALCGALPLDEANVAPGSKVAARVSPPKAEVPDWILATVSQYVANKNRYVVLDDDDPSGATTHTLSADAIIPLPQSEPRTFTRTHEYKERSVVLAMFPDTTCFYAAKVAIPPSKRVRSEG